MGYPPQGENLLLRFFPLGSGASSGAYWSVVHPCMQKLELNVQRHAEMELVHSSVVTCLYSIKSCARVCMRWLYDLPTQRDVVYPEVLGWCTVI